MPPKKLNCIVRRCQPQPPFHRLTRVRALKEKWLKALNRVDLMESESTEHKICGAHFPLKCYPYPGSKILLKNAVPELLQPVSDVSSDEDNIPLKRLKRSATNEDQEILSKVAKLKEGNIIVELNTQACGVSTPEDSSDDEYKIAETIRRLQVLKKIPQSTTNKNLLENPEEPSAMSEEMRSILKKAVALDVKESYNESLMYYQKGIDLLCDAMKSESNETTKEYLKNKIKEYLGRAEKIKELLKDQEKYHEQIIIENNSTGHSYERIFKKFLDSEVVNVKIEDPYIRLFYQCQNFLMFCELLVKNCVNLKNIFLITTNSSTAGECADQRKWLNEIKNSLLDYKIELDIAFHSSLHDRQITFSNGWVVKIGRGLDYFQKASGRFCLGSLDYDLRPCSETLVDIFHQKSMKKSYG